MSDGTPLSTNGTFDTPTGFIRANHDWTTTRPSMAVVETVTAARDEQPTDLPALSSYIDLDALDALVTYKRRSLGDPGIQLSFSVETHEVTVGSDGTVTVEPQGTST